MFYTEYLSQTRNAMSNNTSHVYVLVYPKLKAYKIGKANDVNNRINSLSKHWGDVDYQESYTITVPQSEVFNVEKSLQNLLFEHKLLFKYGDGKNEFFKLDSLNVALSFIKLFNENTSQCKLQKGVVKPAVKSDAGNITHLNGYDLKRRKFHNRFAKTKVSLNDFTIKLNHMVRAFDTLFKFPTKIQYQFEITDHSINFRLINNWYARFWTDFVYKYCSLDIVDFKNSLYTSLITKTYTRNETIQFSMTLNDDVFNDGNTTLLLTYFIQTINAAIKYLPPRSPTLNDDIPVIDEHQFKNDFFDPK